MANTIAYADVFQRSLDTQAVQGATTGWMELNSEQVIYNGGKTIKIPKISLDGLGNYNRDTGYPSGDVTLEYETMTMTQDRGKQLKLDAMDVDESNFALSAGLLAGEFQRTKVIPEIDAYRLSYLATKAITANVSVAYGYTPAKATIIDAFKDAIAKTKKAGFRDIPLVIHATTDVVTEYEKAVGANNLRSATYSQGGLDMRVPAIDGIPIIETDDARMVSQITISENGFARATSAKTINFIVVPVIAPIAVSKQDKMKIFNPEVVQSHDAWLIDYRRYHDCWVMDNKVNGISANFKEAQ